VAVKGARKLLRLGAVKREIVCGKLTAVVKPQIGGAKGRKQALGVWGEVDRLLLRVGR